MKIEAKVETAEREVIRTEEVNVIRVTMEFSEEEALAIREESNSQLYYEIGDRAFYHFNREFHAALFAAMS